MQWKIFVFSISEASTSQEGMEDDDDDNALPNRVSSKEPIAIQLMFIVLMC